MNLLQKIIGILIDCLLILVGFILGLFLLSVSFT